jgi:hypothetical protein
LKHPQNKFRQQIVRVLPVQFFHGNTFSINLLLFLGITFFILVGIDLGTELSLSKDEMNIILETEDSSPLVMCIHSGGSLFSELEELGHLHLLNFSILNHEYSSCPNDRAPPSIN